jgi:hypothetical protein
MNERQGSPSPRRREERSIVSGMKKAGMQNPGFLESIQIVQRKR